MIKEHGSWVAKKAPEKFRTILMNDLRKPNTLPHELVLKFIQEIGLPHEFVISYMEYLVNVLDFTEPKYHLQLCDLYVQEVIKLVGSLNQSQVQLMEKIWKNC